MRSVIVYEAATLEKVAVFTEFVSFVMEEKFLETGSVQFVVNATAENLAIIKAGRMIGTYGCATLGYITTVEQKDGEIWAYGSEAKVLLGRRVYTRTATGGNVESKIRTAFTNSRPLPRMELAASRGLPAVASDYQADHPTLAELCYEMCSDAGYGYRLLFDAAAKKLLLDVWDGEDIGGYVFSERLGNLADLVKVDGLEGWATKVYVHGKNDEGRNIYVTVGTDAGGYASAEAFLDATDVQQTVDDVTMTDAQFRAALTARGRQYLADHTPTNSARFTVATMDYNIDFTLGDWVKARFPDGTSYVVQIITARRVLEGNVEKSSWSLALRRSGGEQKSGDNNLPIEWDTLQRIRRRALQLNADERSVCVEFKPRHQHNWFSHGVDKPRNGLDKVGAIHRQGGWSAGSRRGDD